MRFSLKFLFALTTWVALAAMAGTVAGRYLGSYLAVSLASAGALFFEKKHILPIVLAGVAGAFGMVAGHCLFAFIIPWPTWVSEDARSVVQQMLSDNLLVVSLVWSGTGFILGVAAAVVIRVTHTLFWQQRISN